MRVDYVCRTQLAGSGPHGPLTCHVDFFREDDRAGRRTVLVAADDDLAWRIRGRRPRGWMNKAPGGEPGGQLADRR